ncbi:RIP metalloprotease RseP [Empedobacter brevis]|uniref:RIP metalloprotease RseP n=1 Tax=Empedobacter brevis TaxID=247 RepID=UPI0039AEA959
MLIQIATLMLSLMLLVMLHELGHYVTARWFGVRVERFFCFFDVKFAIWKKKIGDTVYGIGWLPLGGYVKLSGMIDESMDLEQMKQEPKPWEFRVKPAWQRLIIMLGGIIVNIILAMIIYTVLFISQGKTFVDVNKIQYGIETDANQVKLGLQKGDLPIGVNGVKYQSLNEINKEALLGGQTLDVKRDGKEVALPITEDFRTEILNAKGYFFVLQMPTVVDSVLNNSAAQKAGLLKGDKVIAVDGFTTPLFSDLTKKLKEYKGKTTSLSVERKGEPVELMVNVGKDGSIGFFRSTAYLDSLISKEDYTIGEGIAKGIVEPFEAIATQVRGIGTLFQVKDVRKQVAGPIGMVKQMPTEWNWLFFWSFTAMISAWLAFINLLPIPGLDGGHAVFAIYEMVTGKKPSEKVLEKAQMVGVVIILGLMAFIFGNDIVNMIFK